MYERNFKRNIGEKNYTINPNFGKYYVALKIMHSLIKILYQMDSAQFFKILFFVLMKYSLYSKIICISTQLHGSVFKFAPVSQVILLYWGY